MTRIATDWELSPRERERRALRHRLARRRRVIATVITLAVFGLLVLILVSSPGWDRFRETFLSPEHATAALPDITRAFGKNIAMFMIAEPVILVLGGAIAVVRNTVTPWLTPVRLVAIAYTDLFRGIPTLLVVLLLGFGVPSLGLRWVPNDRMFWGTVALILSYGAYVAEVIRAGIDSIHPSQIASAEALGLSRAQVSRFVVLPQAVRRVMPPLLNDFVALQKETSLVSTLGVFEVVFVAQDYGNYHFNFTPYLVAALFFVALTVPLARLTDWLGHRALMRERGR